MDVRNDGSGETACYLAMLCLVVKGAGCQVVVVVDEPQAVSPITREIQRISTCLGVCVTELSQPLIASAEVVVGSAIQVSTAIDRTALKGVRMLITHYTTDYELEQSFTIQLLNLLPLFHPNVQRIATSRFNNLQ